MWFFYPIHHTSNTSNCELKCFLWTKWRTYIYSFKWSPIVCLPFGQHLHCIIQKTTCNVKTHGKFIQAETHNHIQRRKQYFFLRRSHVILTRTQQKFWELLTKTTEYKVTWGQHCTEYKKCSQEYCTEEFRPSMIWPVHRKPVRFEMAWKCRQSTFFFFFFKTFNIFNIYTFSEATNTPPSNVILSHGCSSQRRLS